MKTTRGISAAHRAFFQREPTQYQANLTHDDEAGILIIELPGDAVVAVPAEDLRQWLNAVKGRKE